MDNHLESNFYKTDLLNVTTLTWNLATYLQQGIESLHEQNNDPKLALADDYNIFGIEIKDEIWFADRKAKQETLALTKRNYELVKDQYKKWIDEGSEQFVREVNGTAAWRRMKTNHAAIHTNNTSRLSKRTPSN
jgi:hypothetical protein